MILQALNSYYQRLLARKEPGLSPFGYSPEKISYEIVLSTAGVVMSVNDIRDTSGKKPMPRMLEVPQPEKRAAGINSNFLWDKSNYVLGVSAVSKRSEKEHEAFKNLHRESLTGEVDPGLKALFTFLESWSAKDFQSVPFKEDMLDANFVFRLDGERGHLHERPAAQLVRARLLGSIGSKSSTSHGICLVNGEALPLARLHPVIKGVKDALTGR